MNIPRSFALILVLAAACRNGGSSSPAEAETDTVSFPNVRFYLDGQFRKMDSLKTSLTLYDLHHGAFDSTRIGVAEARKMAAPFLSADPGALAQYTRSVFPDSIHHGRIVSYEARVDSEGLHRVDVFLDSATGRPSQLYLQYASGAPDSLTRLQLIWRMDQDFTLITTLDRNEYTADIRKQKVVWR